MSMLGQTIRDRVMLIGQVDPVAKFEPSNSEQATDKSIQWAGTCNNYHELYTSKFIDTSSMTCQPHLSSLPGDPEFRGIILHDKTFTQGESSLFADASKRNICVIDGAKSAVDGAYAVRE